MVITQRLLSKLKACESGRLRAKSFMDRMGHDSFTLSELADSYGTNSLQLTRDLMWLADMLAIKCEVSWWEVSTARGHFFDGLVKLVGRYAYGEQLNFEADDYIRLFYQGLSTQFPAIVQSLPIRPIDILRQLLTPSPVRAVYGYWLALPDSNLDCTHPMYKEYEELVRETLKVLDTCKLDYIEELNQLGALGSVAGAELKPAWESQQ